MPILYSDGFLVGLSADGLAGLSAAGAEGASPDNT